MVLAGPDEMAADAVVFWRKHLGHGLTPDLTDWLTARVHEVQLLWRDIRFLNRTRAMWQQLSAEIERRDPTNPWTRNYDQLYFEAQVIRLARTVHSKKSRPEAVSLGRLLSALAEKPQFLVALEDDGWPTVPPELQAGADARHDMTELRRLLGPLMAWRDRAIAHTERASDLPTLAWEELDNAIVAVNDVFHRYSRRLTGADYQIEFAGGQWENWQEVFRQPLFVDDPPHHSPPV
jgi:HEPN superfamily AbiU2-like protein